MSQITNKIKAKAVLDQFIELHGSDALSKLEESTAKKIDFDLDLFDKQIDFINDPAKRKSALAGRRSGKSHGSAYYMVKTCYEFSKCVCAFIGITAKSAKDIIWPYIERIILRYKLNAVPSLGDQTWTFPNGSKIVITGADNRKEIRKHFGKHYKLVIIDECGEFGQHLETLVRKVLSPTLIDYGGSLCMIGTPGDICSGFWYKVSTGKIKGWSNYKDWNILNNPKLPLWSGKSNWHELALQELDKIKTEEGYDDESPQYIRQYLGKWHEGGSSMVYGNFNYDSNTFINLPEDEEWNYLMGIDFGTADPSAIIVGAYSPHINTLYIVDEYKKSEISPEEMAHIINFFNKKYKPVSVVADGNGIGAAYLLQLSKMYSIAVKLAEKKDKVAFIDLLNDDLRMRRIKINEKLTDILTEINTYQWADVELKILPEVANDHCLDALLYLWRESIHWMGKPEPKMPKFGDSTYDDYLVQKEIEATENMNNLSFWEEIGGDCEY